MKYPLWLRILWAQLLGWYLRKLQTQVAWIYGHCPVKVEELYGGMLATPEYDDCVEPQIELARQKWSERVVDIYPPIESEGAANDNLL